MKKVFGYLFACGALSGCLGALPTPTPQQIAAARQRQVAANASTCANDYKAKPGTPNFTQCMLALDQQETNAQIQRDALAVSLAGSISPQPYRIPMPNYPMTTPQRPTNCTSRGLGNTLYTTCY